MIQHEFEWTEQDKARALTRADETLRCLREKSMNTVELQEAVGPRPAAYINQLRNMGYEIESSSDGSVALYVLKGFSPKVDVTDEMKAAYYASQHWRIKRAQRLSFDDYRCCNCKRLRHELQVHHWHYDLFNEDIEDLMTFCRRCHERIHEHKNVQVHFPRYVTPEIAARLKGSPS